MKRLAIPPLVALLASQVSCSPAPSATNAPVPRPDASPELPRAIAVLADNPLPGEWSLLRSEGLTIAQFRTDSASDALVAVACMRPSRQVQFLFAPAVRATGRTPGDNRVLTLSVITATERLDLNAVDWSEEERFDLRAGTDARDPSLVAVATPQERIAFETDYFESKINLVFPWDASIATVLKECGG